MHFHYNLRIPKFELYNSAKITIFIDVKAKKKFGDGEARRADFRAEEANNRAVASTVPSLGAPHTLQTPSQRNPSSSVALQFFPSRRSTR